MIHARVSSVADLFFNKLCPGDWNKDWNVTLAGGLFAFLHNTPGTPSISEIADALDFRWHVCLLVDKFVDGHGLRRPNNKICAMWHSMKDPAAIRDEAGRGNWDTPESQLWQALSEGGASIEAAAHQGPLFARPRHYIAWAIVEPTRQERREKRRCNNTARMFRASGSFTSTALSSPRRFGAWAAAS